MSSRKRQPLFGRLKSGLEDGIQFVKGELSLRTVESPEPPPQVSAREIVELRRTFKMSRAVFAALLNVSARTVQSWEQGARRPSHSALRLLQLLREQPEAVCTAAGIRCSTSGRRHRTDTAP